MALQDIAWTVILYATMSKSPNPDDMFCAMVVTLVLGSYSGCAVFLHRIWMCVYKSLLQKSLGALDMWDVKSIHSLRSSKTISNFWVKHRHNLGNSVFMSIIWLSIWLVVGSLEMGCALSYGWYFPEDVFPMYDIVNIMISSCLVVFGLLMLAVQKIMTVSDSFNISTELTMKCLVIMIFNTYSEMVAHTNLIAHAMDDKWTFTLVAVSGCLLLQLLIMDYHLYMTLRTSVNSSSKRYTVDVNMVLKDENLFTNFEEQLKREFNVENLNFLVSCIHYSRTVIAQGQFGIGTSFTELENETFNMLNWRGTLGEEDADPNKIARFIYNEFCVRGAPQEINLNENTSRRLSTRMKNLSNVYNYAEPELFIEAFDFIKDQLENDSVIRFKRRMNLPRGVQFHTDSIEGLGYGLPLLASRTQ